MKAKINLRNHMYGLANGMGDTFQVIKLDNDLVNRLVALVQDRVEELEAYEIDEDHAPIEGALDECSAIDDLLRALFAIELQLSTFNLTFTKQVEAWDEDHAKELGEEIADSADIYLEEVDED